MFQVENVAEWEKDKRNYCVFTGPELAFYLLCNLEFLSLLRCLRVCKRETDSKGENWKVCSVVWVFLSNQEPLGFQVTFGIIY